MNFAQLVDAIPVVQSTADRGRRFPTPATDQRVHNKQTGDIERWTGSAWVADFEGSGATANLMPAGSAALPGLAFVDDVTTGLYEPVAGTIGLSVTAVGRVQWTAGAYTPVTAGGISLGTAALPWGATYLGAAVIGVDPGGAEPLRVGGGARINGALTVLTGGLTVTGASTITGTLGGVTTLTATTLIGTLSTVAQPNITSLGTLTALTISGSLTLSAAVGKIIPGATSLSHRNTADSADNLLIADAGAITIRGDLTWTSGALRRLGTSDAFGLTLKTNALDRWSLDTAGNLLADTTNGGTVQSRVGTSSTVAKHPTIIGTIVNQSTSSTSEVSVASFTLPANALAVNQQRARVVIYGIATTQNAVINLKFGATSALSVTITAGNRFWIMWSIARTGAATQQMDTVIVQTGATGGNTSVTAAETLSGAVTIDLRGSVTAGGTLTYTSAECEVLAT